jgi:hypothetical protein
VTPRSAAHRGLLSRVEGAMKSRPERDGVNPPRALPDPDRSAVDQHHLREDQLRIPRRYQRRIDDRATLRVRDRVLVVVRKQVRDRRP